MTTERINDFLSLRLPDNYRLEHATDEEGKENYQILCEASQGSDGEWTAVLTVKLQLPDKEGEIPEDKRNLNGNFHAGLTANIHEVPALLWTVNALVVALLLEHQRHTCVLACYETVRSRDELNDFAGRAADHLNVLLGWVESDGECGQMEPITPDQLLELANVAEPLSEEAAQEEEKQRVLEQFAQEHPTGEGMSVRAVYRDPITGKVKRDLFWERAGAESGDPEAMIKLALAYLNGDGVEQSNEKAAEYMRQAAELDEPTAQYNMGMFYIQGCGVERDLAQAERWMERARDNGDGDAEGILRSLKELPKLRENAQTGDPAALSALARELMAMKGEDNYREAVKYARKAAEGGSLEGMWVLALAYDNGRGVPQSYQEAFRWYSKAAEAGHAPSQANLACLYARGDGVKKDMRKAEEWVRKSAEQGDPDGLRLLRNIDPQRAMELEQAAWEEKWRRQQAEEQKQRAAEWMKNYGQYLEKNPRIVINGSKFVFAGVMEDNWNDILQKLMEKGGLERGAVSGKTDYLVVDPRGYGESKVKEALAQRIKGKTVKIVLLEDFLKALGMGKPGSGTVDKSKAPEQKRSAEERRPTPKQIENRGFKDDIVAFMEPDTLYTAQNIAESVPSVVAAGLSVNRVMAMLTQLVNDGSLIRTEDKQKTYFSLASQNEKQQRPQPSALAAAVRQPTPKQVSYTGFKADILAWMKPDTLYTAQDITKGVPSVVAAGFSVDRVMPYLTQLSDDGALEKTDDGAKRYYSLPGTEAKRSAREKAEREEKEREAAAALRTVLAHRQEEERRKAEEARRQEEERRKAEEARRQEEERRKAEEEARRQEEERRRAEEEARKAEEAHRRAEEAAAARQKTAETAYSGTEAHTEKGKSGVNKTVLILAVALTLVTGILIGVLVSHAAGGKRGGENPAVLMPQTNAGESLDIDNGEATAESIESQGQAGVSLPNKENRLDTVIVDENNMRPIFIDDKAIKVSLNSFSYANNETVYGLNILLENRSDKTVSVVLTDVEIDSFEISTSQGKMAVSPGHSAICYSTVWQKNIDEAGIQDWSELAGTILVREDYFGEPIYSVPVIIKRSCWEYEKTFHDTSFKPVAPTKAEAPDGAVVLSSKNATPILLEQDGVRLSINSFSTSNSGTVFKINFLLENGTDEDMSVVLTDVVINGYEISTSQGKMMVSAGKKAVCDSSIWEKDLKLAHIEEWTELQGTILVRKDYFGEELFSIPVIIYKDVW